MDAHLTGEGREDAEHAADADVVRLAGPLELVVSHLHQTACHDDDALLLQFREPRRSAGYTWRT